MSLKHAFMIGWQILWLTVVIFPVEHQFPFLFSNEFSRSANAISVHWRHPSNFSCRYFGFVICTTAKNLFASLNYHKLFQCFQCKNKI